MLVRKPLQRLAIAMNRRPSRGDSCPPRRPGRSHARRSPRPGRARRARHSVPRGAGRRCRAARSCSGCGGGCATSCTSRSTRRTPASAIRLERRTATIALSPRSATRREPACRRSRPTSAGDSPIRATARRSELRQQWSQPRTGPRSQAGSRPPTRSSTSRCRLPSGCRAPGPVMPPSHRFWAPTSRPGNRTVPPRSPSTSTQARTSMRHATRSRRLVAKGP